MGGIIHRLRRKRKFAILGADSFIHSLGALNMSDKFVRTVGILENELFLLHHISTLTLGGYVWFSLENPDSTITPSDESLYNNQTEAVVDLRNRGGTWREYSSIAQLLAVQEAEHSIEAFLLQGGSFVDKTPGL